MKTQRIALTIMMAAVLICGPLLGPSQSEVKAKKAHVGVWIQTFISCEVVGNESALPIDALKGIFCKRRPGDVLVIPVTVSKDARRIEFLVDVTPKSLSWFGDKSVYVGEKTTETDLDGTPVKNQFTSVVSFSTAEKGSALDTSDILMVGKSFKIQTFWSIKLDTTYSNQ